jgi:tetratricopeptide (TPR) repeat protein
LNLVSARIDDKVMRALKVAFLCIVAIMVADVARPAVAQQPADVSACRSERDRQRKIEACSRVIGDATLPASVRAEALVSRAIIYNLLGAIDFKDAVGIDPASGSIRKARASYHFSSGRLEQAIADYDEAIRIDPGDAAAYHQRGDVRLMQKRYSEAIADYRKAIELKPIDAKAAWGQCQASASWLNAFFHCTHVAGDVSQAAEVRASAQRRLDSMMGRAGSAP